MGETFMTANTQIEELISKKKQIIERTASLLTEAVIDRIKNGNLTRNTEKDVKNSIRDFNEEEQIEILSRAMVMVGMNINKGSGRSFEDDDNSYFTSGTPKKVKSRSDIFGGRRFDD